MIKIKITKIIESSSIKEKNVKIIRTVSVDKDGDSVVMYIGVKTKIEDESLTESSILRVIL